MPADAAKYLLSIADMGSQNFEVTGFVGVDSISSPYWFDIGSNDTRYTIRLVPKMYLLTLNFTSRIFQNLTIPDIIKNVVKMAGLKESFRYELKSDDIKYPTREFCVQYQETDLAFISRLMEECGIWYYFEQVQIPDGTQKERAVVTDDFSKYPKLGRSIPFMRGSGQAEITDIGNVVESVNYIATGATLMPQNVRVRTYNHRVPEAPPDGRSDVTGGHVGQIYEYGGSARNSKRGAEMVLAYVDGNPDKPLGLGYVPNAASPSVTNNVNKCENVIRSWGGNELVMDDTPGNKNIYITTPDNRGLELHDGDKIVKIKSEHNEMLFNDADKFAHVDAGGHKIHLNYKDDEGGITIATLKGNVIKMDDTDDSITMQNINDENKVALNGKDPSITIDSNGNTMTLNGKDNRITMESGGSKIAVDGQNNKILLESNDNKFTVDGSGNGIAIDSTTITISATGDICLKAGGKVIFDAKGGILNKSPSIDLDQGQGNSDNIGKFNNKEGMKKKPQSKTIATDKGDVGSTNTIRKNSTDSISPTHSVSANTDRGSGPIGISASEPIFVKQVFSSKKEALTDDEVIYKVVRYNIDNVAETYRNSVKWKVKVDGKYEDLKNIMGEEIKLKMKPEWGGKDILVMAYLHSPREDVGESTRVIKRLVYKGTKNWGTLQRDFKGDRFAAKGHTYELNELRSLMKNGKKRLSMAGYLRLAYLNDKTDQEVKSIYEDCPLVGARWVLSNDNYDLLQYRVINHFYAKSGDKLSFGTYSELSKNLHGYKPFDNYYNGYLKVLKMMIEENTLETIDGKGIEDYFRKLKVPYRPNFSHMKDIGKYDYYGLMGNTQTITVDLEIKQIDIKSYEVKTKMYIGDWYGADFDDINYVVKNPKGNIPSLNAFFWLQHHFGYEPFETEIIYADTNRVDL